MGQVRDGCLEGGVLEHALQLQHQQERQREERGREHQVRGDGDCPRRERDELERNEWVRRSSFESYEQDAECERRHGRQDRSSTHPAVLGRPQQSEGHRRDGRCPGDGASDVETGPVGCAALSHKLRDDEKHDGDDRPVHQEDPSPGPGVDQQARQDETTHSPRPGDRTPDRERASPVPLSGKLQGDQRQRRRTHNCCRGALDEPPSHQLARRLRQAARGAGHTERGEPSRKTRRRPNRSPMRPPNSRSPPNVRKYAFATHATPAVLNPRSVSS